jgi:dihydroorotate dehydrogenase
MFGTDCHQELQTIGEGGLSGAPLGSRSTAIVSKLFRLSKGRIRIIGVGGIFDANDAWEKVSAGASLIQTYTGFIYKGVTIARDINEGLQEILLKNGIKSFDDAVGCRAHELEEKF